uniref:Cadherin n=2 Tax=Caenorhabditis tropicalis TaxID=1561998 RepID=A0A1I7TQD6_9PELO
MGYMCRPPIETDLIVVNSAASGRYTLEITLDDETSESPSKSVDVFVENSQSHAHFRKPKYSVEIDAKKAEKGLKLTQVELEGVPIDEAKIMILDGNPGWVTVEEYGGIVNVGKYDGGQEDMDNSDRNHCGIRCDQWKRTREKEEEIERNRVMEVTFDRENSEVFDVQLDERNLKVDVKSMYGIDEKGRKVPLDPTSISVTPTHLQLSPDSLKSLRLLGMTLKNPDGSSKLHFLIRLISSPKYLETQEKLAARPVYPSPWSHESPEIHVALQEELAPGQVIGVYPAVSRKNISYISKEIQVNGPMKEAFEFNETTGELKIRQRIDYESLDDGQREFNLTLESGEEEGFKSQAILMMKVIDVDDNSPVVEMDGVEEISIPENLPAGTKITELKVTDPDGSDEYTVALEGERNKNFRANITSSGILSIFIAENAKIDREISDSEVLLIRISDKSGNSERILLPIRILDVNDNSPVFDQKMNEVEVMEDWPRGIVIDRIHAMDSDDQGPSSDVSYRILKSEDLPDVISINSTTGIVHVAGDLWGLGRETPYKFQVIAEDSGAPSLNSTSILSLRIRNKEDVITEESVEFLEPKTGAEIKVKENLPLDTKILTVKADLRGIPSKTHGKLVYSMKDLLNSEKEPSFAIDKDSGDVFVVKSIDYETIKEYTVSFYNRLRPLPEHKGKKPSFLFF